MWLLAVQQRCSTDVFTGKQPHPLTNMGSALVFNVTLMPVTGKWHGIKLLAALQYYGLIYNYRRLHEIL